MQASTAANRKRQALLAGVGWEAVLLKTTVQFELVMEHKGSSFGPTGGQAPSTHFSASVHQFMVLLHGLNAKCVIVYYIYIFPCFLSKQLCTCPQLFLFVLCQT